MFTQYLSSSFALIILDMIYLSLTKNYFSKQIKLVQKTPLKLNLTATIACYILLSLGIYYFVVFKNLSYKESFFLGFFVYGIYDLTTMAVFKDWKLNTVILDSLWGGTLFVLVKYLSKKINQIV